MFELANVDATVRALSSTKEKFPTFVDELEAYAVHALVGSADVLVPSGSRTLLHASVLESLGITPVDFPLVVLRLRAI